MKKTSITCDFCSQDLSETDGVDAYRVVLGCEKLPNNSNIHLDMYIEPPLRRLFHFCGIDGCLKRWINKETCEVK